MLVSHADVVDEVEMRQWDHDNLIESLHKGQSFSVFVVVDEIAEVSCRTSETVVRKLAVEKVLDVEDVETLFQVQILDY